MSKMTPEGELMRQRLRDAADQDGVLPRGFSAKLADEMGLDRSTVHKAAAKMGLVVAVKFEDPDERALLSATTAITRRCRNKDCIVRFVPVNEQHWYHEPACASAEADRKWAIEDILGEESTLLVGSTNLELAKAAFGQKNSVMRENTRLRSLRDYLTYELQSFYDEHPETRYPVIPLRESIPSSKGPREILVQLSDWQIGKWEQGFGVAATLERVEDIKRAIRSIVDRQRAAGYAVDRVVISWGGDMVEGCYIYGGQNVTGLDRTSNTHRLIQQIRLVAHQMAALAVDVATYVERVDNQIVGGNHGRPNGKNDFADPEDNFDVMAGWWASDVTANTERISWTVHENWWGGFEVAGHYVVSFHGDNWRGPLEQLESLLPMWITSGEIDRRPDLVLTHHRHGYRELDVAGIPVLQNGTIDGGSRHYVKQYGRSSGAAQRVVVLSERRCYEASWPIRFKKPAA